MAYVASLFKIRVNPRSKIDITRLQTTVLASSTIYLFKSTAKISALCMPPPLYYLRLQSGVGFRRQWTLWSHRWDLIRKLQSMQNVANDTATPTLKFLSFILSLTSFFLFFFSALSLLVVGTTFTWNQQKASSLKRQTTWRKWDF